jgi:nucleosome binding factor SPN SPT16 subunit
MFGIVRKRAICEVNQKLNINKIRAMQDKSKCFDIFYKAKINGKYMNEQQPIERIIKFKQDLKHKKNCLTKMHFIKSMKMINGILSIQF